MPSPCTDLILNLILDQEKLDVAQKTRANLFNWRGQFTPELVEYLRDTYSAPGDIVADPFAGSGTVLLESVRKGLRCQGLEINPAAYAMSRFYTLCNLKPELRSELFQSKDQDFTVGKTIYYQLSPDTAFPGHRTERGELFLSVLSAEIKVNLDKTMFQECSGTASRLKQGCPSAKYFVLVEKILRAGRVLGHGT